MRGFRGARTGGQVLAPSHAGPGPGSEDAGASRTGEPDHALRGAVGWTCRDLVFGGGGGRENGREADA